MSFLAEHSEPSPTRRGSSPTARIVSPVIAVVPWLLTMGGLWAIGRGHQRVSETFQIGWGWVWGAAALFIVAALVWAAVTAWSSVGTTLAGSCTLVFGLLLITPATSREIYGAFPGMNDDLLFIFTSLAQPVYFLLVGSLLLAAGLGAAGARRAGVRAAGRAHARRRSDAPPPHRGDGSGGGW